MLSKKNRLPGFKIPEVLKKGKKTEKGFLKFFYLKPSQRGAKRITVIVPKKIFKGAVERNRTKRLLREAIKQKLDLLDQEIFAVVMAKKELEGKNLKQIKTKIEEIFESIND